MQSLFLFYLTAYKVGVVVLRTIHREESWHVNSIHIN